METSVGHMLVDDGTRTLHGVETPTQELDHIGAVQAAISHHTHTYTHAHTHRQHINTES